MALTSERVEEILDVIEDGKPLSRILDNTERKAFYRKLEEEPSLVPRYTRARLIRAETFNDRQIEVVERVLDGTLDPHAAKVAIGTLQWQQSKLNRKDYGEQVDLKLEHIRKVTVLLGAEHGRDNQGNAREYIPPRLLPDEWETQEGEEDATGGAGSGETGADSTPPG